MTTVKDAAGTPPKLTAVVPVKLIPVIVTTVPATPTTGVKELIAGSFALFLKTEMVLEVALAVIISGLPSPSISARHTP